VQYRNKKGKINFFDLPSSYDELISSDSESEDYLNFVDSDETFEDEFCNDPHCTDCKECDRSDPDICRCNAVRMMKTDYDEINKNIFSQMMVASDPQIKNMYKTLSSEHLNKAPSDSKKATTKGYVPPDSLFSVEALTRQFRNEDFGEDFP